MRNTTDNKEPELHTYELTMSIGNVAFRSGLKNGGNLAFFQMIGNAAILDCPDKVAFLSSRRISPADVLKCYEWAEKVRNTEQCVISGFQSPLEKDVLKFLLRGKAPVILVLARSLWKRRETGS